MGVDGAKGDGDDQMEKAFGLDQYSFEVNYSFWWGDFMFFVCCIIIVWFCSINFRFKEVLLTNFNMAYYSTCFIIII